MFLWKLGGAHHVHNMAAAGLGSSQWWGFSPALDLTAVYDGKRRCVSVRDLLGMSCLVALLCYVRRLYEECRTTGKDGV